MNYKILSHDEYNLYLEHIKINMKNSRVNDPGLIEKISIGLSDPRIIIFAGFKNGKIENSILTKKRINYLEYFIVNYRTNSSAKFNLTDFLDLFDFVLRYYEEIQYYRWISARPINLFGKFFKDTNNLQPFDRYMTVIEYAPSIFKNENLVYHEELLSGIPDSMLPEDFIVVSGLCKQEFSASFESLNSIFI